MLDLNEVYVHLGEVKDAINQIEVKNQFGKFGYIDKVICFIYSAVMDFHKTEKTQGIPESEKFIENVKGILNNKTHIYHSYISGEILGYSHSYYNLKVKENKKQISVIAHNFFHFDFFLKGIRAGLWRTRYIGIGG